MVEAAKGNRIIDYGHRVMFGSDLDASVEHVAAQQCTRILHWTSKYEQNTGDGSNPFALVAAVAPACMPGMHIGEIVKDPGAAGKFADSILGVLSQSTVKGSELNVGTFSLGNQPMLDISGRFNLFVPGQKPNTAANLSVLLTETRNYWIVIMLAAGNETELNEIRESVKFKFNVPSQRSSAAR
jgi:hypothetical protein